MRSWPLFSDEDGDLALYDGQQWTSTGVLSLAGGTDYGNFVRAVAVDPSNPSTLWAGTGE